MNPLRRISDWLHGRDLDPPQPVPYLEKYAKMMAAAEAMAGDHKYMPPYSWGQGHAEPARGGYIPGGMVLDEGKICFGVDFGQHGPSIIGASFDDAGAMHVHFTMTSNPKFEISDTVWVDSDTYGRHLSMVVGVERLGASWRYTVNDQALHPSFKANSRRRRLLCVREDVLERYRAPMPWNGPIEPLTGSQEAAEIHFDKLVCRNPAADRELLWDTASMTFQNTTVEGPSAWHEALGHQRASADEQEPGQVHGSGYQKVLTTAEIKRNYYLSEIKAWAERGNDGMVENLRDELLSMWHADVFPGKSVYWVMGLTEAEYDAWVEKKGE